jgi:excisionase family DNA binding protein
MVNKLYTIAEYAALKKYSKTYIYKLVKSRRIKAYKLRGRWIVAQSVGK